MGTLSGQQRTQNLGRQWDSAENCVRAHLSVPNSQKVFPIDQAEKKRT